MADDDKQAPGTSPTPDELQQSLQDFFGKMGNVQWGGMAGMNREVEESVSETPQGPGADSVFEFDYIPRDIKSHLDRFVIRQDEAKKALSIAVCDHYNHAKYLRSLENENGKLPEGVELQKQNVIVVGPTGVGKTYLVKHIAELIGVPFVKADATKFSETGYVGGDVDDLVRDLVQKAEGDLDLAEFGIIYIDEIDKIATRSEMIGRDVSGRGVQTTLLKLMEETEVPLTNPMDIRSQMKSMMSMQQGGGGATKDTVNTRHILFIVSGAFSGLEKVVRKRLSEGQIGFGADPTERPMDGELFNQVETQDFIDFGFEAEFIGRLPVRVVCEKLSAADLENILKFSEGSLLRQYEREFEAYGIMARFEDSAIGRIASLAEKENTGARALMTVCERLLRDFKFELPGTSVSELSITDELIDRREELLEEYRELGRKVDVEKASRELDAFCRDFQEEHGVELVFKPEALSKLAEEAAAQGRSLLQLCRQRFRDVQFGLKLIQKNTGRMTFEIGPEAVEDPDKYLSDLVVKSYRSGTSEEEDLSAG
ncbi:MAG TPA: ATP-dependent protease [Verrucomicrobiales bacterium]|nr:ATP-dependent protease [Verrucomicrobiales bacterium]